MQRPSIRAMTLTVYASLLLLAGLPTSGPFHDLLVIQLKPEALLQSFTLTPGLKLFNRPYVENLKVRGQCIFIKSKEVAGVVRERLRFGRSCSGDPSRMQWFASPYETIFHRLLEDSAYPRVVLSLTIGDSAFSNQTAPGSREQSLLASTGDFFCRSMKDDQSPREIWLAWRQDRIDYVSGQISYPYVLIYHWDCAGKFKDIVWGQSIKPTDIVKFEHGQD